MNKPRFILTLFVLISILSVQCSQKHYTSIDYSYWKYIDEDITYEVYFKPDGHIYSYHPSDATPEDDFWKQRGKKISFQMNNGYARYKGLFINDSTIVGKGKSKGFKWKWSAKFISKD